MPNFASHIRTALLSIVWKTGSKSPGDALERRRIAHPKGLGLRRFSKLDYSRELRPVEWGSGVSLHGSNPEPLMSALGQKQTSRHLQPMSALPPKADIGTQSWNVRFVPIADILKHR
jgi:hypothetical protein